MAIIIGVDFDGTLVDHRYPAVGDAVRGAFPWLKKFQAAGARLVLLTMRSDGRPDHGDVLAAAVEFCRRRGVEFWAVNANPEQATWTSSPKVYCHVYIDDAAACCPLRPCARPGPSLPRPVVDWSVVGPAVMATIRAHTRVRATPKRAARRRSR